MEVILKKGKERAIQLGHHWIFSGALQSESAEDGSIIPVKNSKGETLGWGYYNSRSQIRVRMLTFKSEPFTNDNLRSLICESFARRKNNPFLESTNAYRVVFSEGDFLPGLIIDDYAGHLVIQYLTLGIDRIKDSIVEILLNDIKPLSIYERSDYAGRKLEGLKESSGQVFGETPSEILIHEHDVKYPVDVKGGQKTGFFLDQRENRKLIKDLAKGKSVENLFSYTGGFTMAALSGGASSAVSIDISAKANAEAEKIHTLNGFTAPSEFVSADVFDYVRQNKIDADIIIVDPPAFAKSRGDVNQACRGYKDINLNVIKNAKPGAYVLTCSCSRFIDADLFQKVIFSAVCDAGRQAQIIRRTGHPADHPVNIAVPETEYLKGLLLKVIN
jgi:23S rRNA (cytosine1962-C5)-methyltransferase